MYVFYTWNMDQVERIKLPSNKEEMEDFHSDNPQGLNNDKKNSNNNNNKHQLKMLLSCSKS